MTERQPIDLDARQMALDPTGSYIVQAPAGSGKTSLLTDRILALLATVEQPEQIVAMTFTRKAAAEMHMRVMEKLQLATVADAPTSSHERQAWELAQLVLERDRAQGWGLLDHPSRLRIQTIDSFCASIVRSMPWLTGLGGMPKIVEHAPALYECAATRVIELADQFDCVRQLLKHLDMNVSLAVNALGDMLGKRDQWLPLLGHAKDSQKLQAFLHQTMLDQLRALAESMPLGWQQILAPATRLAAQTLMDQEKSDHSLVELIDWVEGEIGPDFESLNRWRAVAKLLLTKESKPRKLFNVSLGFVRQSKQKQMLEPWLNICSDTNPNATWVRNLSAVLDMPDPDLDQAHWEILDVQLKCLQLAAAQLMVIFAERGEVDFIEVSRRAVQALGDSDDPSDLLLKLDNRIAHILVDEFQDTSQTQLDLLQLLTSGWLPDDGRTLFLVGDPMQSIYRFRKAEVGLFLQVQQQGLGQVQLTPLTLATNFRSQAGVVNWVNDAFSKIFPEMNQAEFGAIRYEPATAWHDAKDHAAVFWHINDSEQQALQEVVQIAQHAWQTYAQSSKPMAILVRARGHLGEVARRLSQIGIPVRATELDRLQSRSVVVDLLQLTRALLHRGDRAAWFAVLRAPWCGLTLGTLQTFFYDRDRSVSDVLAELLLQGQAPVSVDADQWKRLSGVGAVLLEGLAQHDGLPFVARLEQVWRALQADCLLSDEADLADAQAYLSLLERLATFSEVDVDELERQLPLLYAQPQGSGRAIDVMTMHKAKGLEFDVVVLLALDRKAPPDRTPLVRIEQTQDRVLFGPIKSRIQESQDPLSAYLAQRESTRISHEIDRLLYVAATRAKQELHLVGTSSMEEKTGDWQDPTKGSLLCRLWELRPRLPAPVPTPESQSGIKVPEPFWRAPEMRRRCEPLPMPSVCAQSGPRGFDHYHLPALESAERLTGILIHAWLAQFASSGRPVNQLQVPSTAILVKQLRALGLASPLRAKAADDAIVALRAMLSSERGRWLLEQPLRKVEWALIDSCQTISIMDLAIDRGDHWLVVDYKTTRLADHESAQKFADRMRARYGGQMARYREQLHQFDGRSVRSVLYFPTDDQWVEVS